MALVVANAFALASFSALACALAARLVLASAFLACALAVFAARRADAVCLAMGDRLHRCDGGNRWIGMVEFGDGGAAALAVRFPIAVAPTWRFPPPFPRRLFIASPSIEKGPCSSCDNPIIIRS